MFWKWFIIIGLIVIAGIILFRPWLIKLLKQFGHAISELIFWGLLIIVAFLGGFDEADKFKADSRRNGAK